jgi:hypothetical protein
VILAIIRARGERASAPTLPDDLKSANEQPQIFAQA